MSRRAPIRMRGTLLPRILLLISLLVGGRAEAQVPAGEDGAVVRALLRLADSALLASGDVTPGHVERVERLAQLRKGWGDTTGARRMREHAASIPPPAKAADGAGFSIVQITGLSIPWSEPDSATEARLERAHALWARGAFAAAVATVDSVAARDGAAALQWYASRLRAPSTLGHGMPLEPGPTGEVMRSMVMRTLALGDRVLPSEAERAGLRLQLARAQAGEDSAGAWGTARGLSGDAFALLGMERGLARLRRLDRGGAEAVAAALPPGAPRDTLLGMLASYRLRGGDAAGAVRLAGRMGPALGAEVKERVAVTLLRVGERAEAIRLLREALAGLNPLTHRDPVFGGSMPVSAIRLPPPSEARSVVQWLGRVGERDALLDWARAQPDAERRLAAVLLALDALRGAADVPR